MTPRKVAIEPHNKWFEFANPAGVQRDETESIGIALSL
jgi:hypothetical protein